MAAPGASVVIEAVSATLDAYRNSKPVNQHWTDTPDFDTLKSVIESKGGRNMRVRLRGGRSAAPTVVSRRDGGFVPVKAVELVSTAEFAWGNPFISHVMTDWLDDEDNTGPEAIVDLAKLKAEDAYLEQKKYITSHLNLEHGARPADTPLSWDSLTDASVTAIGGIDSAVAGNEFWTPYTAASTGNPEKDLRVARNNFQATADGEMPNICHAGLNFWNQVQEYLVSNNLGNQIGGSAEVGFVEVTIWGWTIKYNPRMSVSKVHLLHGPSLAAAHQNGMFIKPLEAQFVPVEDAGDVLVTQNKVLPIATRFTLGCNRRNTLGQIHTVAA